MYAEIQPFPAFTNVESSRAYVDNLFSDEPEKCLSSLISIKNAVIGSNRQKENVIEQGILPRLMDLLRDKQMQPSIREEAAITIGSLAKGTQDHVELLINSGTINLLLDVLQEDEPKLVDACLNCLRTLTQQDSTNINTKFHINRLERLMCLARADKSIQRQACVASILGAACKTSIEQDALCKIGAPIVLAELLSVQSTVVRVPAAFCLAAICFNNPATANQIVNTVYEDVTLPEILANLTLRDRPVALQVEAARCLTNLHRSGAISSNDVIIIYKTLPCLVRLVQTESEVHRAAAADTLAYLTEMDSELQQIAAISNQVITGLVDLLNCPSVTSRQAAFRAFASLGANDEDIRKRIIVDTKFLMDRVMESLEDENKDIRLAAVRCLHSLSRSVQQLRTTFQDYSVWQPLMALLVGSPSIELLSATSSALCNLLLAFSPAKEPMLQQGVVQLLVQLTQKDEASLRLNGVWALMNLAFQSEQRVKSQILTALGTERIFRLLADADTRVLMKTLGLLRNLVSPRQHTDTMMALHGPQIMQGVVLVLEGHHSPEVKEQALCILGNIADGERAREHIMSNDDVLKKLVDYMTHPALCLQEASIYCINNLIRLGESGAVERQNRFKEMGVVNILQQLMSSTSDSILFNRVKTGLSQFSGGV